MSQAEQCYIGVDLGASSGRVMAGLFDGKRIRLDEMHRFPNGGVHVGDSLRWNVLDLWSSIEAGLQAAATQYAGNVRSVGVDTWGVDYVLMSKSNEILGPPYHYRDHRTDGILDRAFLQVSKREIFFETGLQFLPFNTLFQLFAQREADRSLLEYADRLLMMPDFFHWCLSGSRVIEFTNATTTQCYHPGQRNWATGLLGKFGIPTDIFPEVVPTGTKLGRLRDGVAKRTGLSRIDVVASTTHDTGAAVAAVPTTRTGSASWAYISSGTWSLMGLELDDAIITDRAFELEVTNEGGIDGTYRLLKNIMGLWLIQESRRCFSSGDREVSFDELVQAASRAKPFVSLIDPDDSSFLTPDDMPAAIREWCGSRGETVPETEGAVIRCALESLALKYRLVLDRLEELSGTRVEEIHIVGGGCQNALLNQFTANACGRPVIAGPSEATALGNILVQARAQGEIGTLAEIRDVVRNSYQMERFEPADVDQWAAAYGRFCQLV